jgi:glycosyltransferase involved in cell wall biosynthesis
MPAYNEEAVVAEAVAAVRRHVLDALPGAELVVVDDGSRDRTGAILDGLARVDPRVRVIHRANGGHGPALRTGLDAARGDYLFLLDSDLQIPLEAFGALWAAARGRDGAFGVRADRHDPALRIWLSRAIAVALRLLFGVRLADANVPFKVVRRAAWEAARPAIPPDTLAPSLFLAVWMRAGGLDVAEQPVPHRRRATGRTAIRRWRLLRFCARAFGQLLAFRRRLPR